MSQKKAFDNIMNYFNEGDEEEEEEEEEESNYILNFDINQNTINKKKKNSSLKQVNSNLTINSSNEEKIVQNNLDNNYISYFGNDPSRPETPKLNCDNNNIEDEKEQKLIKLNNKENNSNNNEDISNNIFSETLETKIKNIDSNSVSILENTDNNFEYNETPNTRQTFRKTGEKSAGVCYNVRECILRSVCHAQNERTHDRACFRRDDGDRFSAAPPAARDGLRRGRTAPARRGAPARPVLGRRRGARLPVLPEADGASEL